MTTTAHTFHNNADTYRYMFAGNATVTIQSVSGKHFTYRIRRRKAEGKGAAPDFYFVSVRDGSEYQYIGYVRQNIMQAGQKGDASVESYRAFEWLVRQLLKKSVMHPKLTVQHEGACGRCGRQLTNPGSIDSGIGPECARFVVAA